MYDKIKKENIGDNSKMKIFAKISIVILSLSTIAPLNAPVIAQVTNNNPQSANGKNGFSNLAKKLLPAVVGIRSLNPNIRKGPMFGNNEATISTGSGFIYDNKGHVITNNHVTENGIDFEISFNDGSIKKAKLIGRDPDTDIAVLKLLSPHSAPIAPLANSDAVDIGDWAIAIGSPFGLGNSFSVGVISGRNRDLQSGRFDNFLQTDAAINSGNSGGPLFNEFGHVIGVNTAIVASAQTGGNIGIGFAVPSNVVKRIAGDIINYGYVRRGYAGFRARNATPQEGTGVVITATAANSPSKTAGIRLNDRYFSAGNIRLTDSRQLARIIADAPIGSTIRLDGYRGKQRIFANVKITLPPSLQTNMNNGNETIAKTAGMSLRNANLEEQKKSGVGAKVIVISVDSFGKAKNSIMAGDFILQINGKDINTPSQARAITDELLKNNKVIFIKIRRNNRELLKMIK